MPTTRIPLAHQIEGRNSSDVQDAISYNCIFETKGQEKQIVKRPGTSFFSAGSTSITLISLSPATVASGAGPAFGDISSDGLFYYVAINGPVVGSYGTGSTIYQYSRNTTNGLLSPLSPATVSAGSGVMDIKVTPNGLYAYAVNYGSNGLGNTISQYNRNIVTGQLTPMTIPTITVSVGQGLNSLKISPDGNHVYVTSWYNHLINQFSIDTTGNLVPLSTAYVSVGIGPAGMCLSPDGKFLYVTSYGASNGTTIGIWSRASTGLLTFVSNQTTGSAPNNICCSTNNLYLYVANYTANTVTAYTRNTTTGTLTIIGSPLSAGTQPIGVRVSPNGQFVFVTSYSTALLYMYIVNGDGSLSPGTPASITTGLGPDEVVISADSSFAYISNNGTGANTISQYSISSGGTSSGGGKGLFSWNNTLVAGQSTSLYSVNPTVGNITTFTGTISGTIQPFSFISMDKDQWLMFHNGTNIYVSPKNTTTLYSPTGGTSITHISLTNTGGGYSTTPVVTITGTGTGAVATANLNNGSLTSITLEGGGNGYTGTPTISISAPTPITTAQIGICTGTYAPIHEAASLVLNYSSFNISLNTISFTGGNTGIGYPTTPTISFIFSTYLNFGAGYVPVYWGPVTTTATLANSSLVTVVLPTTLKCEQGSWITTAIPAGYINTGSSITINNHPYVMSVYALVNAPVPVTATATASLSSSILGPYVPGLTYLDGYAFIMTTEGIILQSEPVGGTDPVYSWGQPAGTLGRELTGSTTSGSKVIGFTAGGNTPGTGQIVTGTNIPASTTIQSSSSISGVVVTTGGTLQAGYYVATLVIVTASGTIVCSDSLPVNITSTAGTSSIVWSWGAKTEATGYQIWVTNTTTPSVPATCFVQSSGTTSSYTQIGPIGTNPSYPDTTCAILSAAATASATGLTFSLQANPGNPWNPLNSISNNSDPDIGVAISKQLNYIVGFGAWHTDFYYDAGNAVGSVLAKNQSAKMEIGCAVGTSVAKAPNTVVWVGQTKAEGRGVYHLEGLAPSKISTRYIEKILNNASLLNTNVYSTCFSIAGHTLYMLTLVSANRTLVYDLDEKSWYQWTSYNGTSAGCFTLFSFTGNVQNSPNLYFQNINTGQIYTMSPTLYQDAGQSIQFAAITPILDFGSTKRKFFRRVEVVGDKIAANLAISHTEDDYATYNTPRTVALNSSRAILYQNGSSRRRAWKIASSDNYPIRLDAIEVDVEQSE